MCKVTTRLHTDQLLLKQSVTDLHTGQQRLEFKLDAVTAAQIASTAEREVRRSLSHATTPMDLSQRLTSTPPTRILTPLALSMCPTSCTCRCHQRRVKRTPDRLQDFIGGLFLGYSGMPIITLACDNSVCGTRSSPILFFMYVFPAWMLARAFVLIAKLSLSHGLQLNIRLPRILDYSAIVWKFAELGDIRNIREMYQKRAVTPYDVDSRSGYTTLVVRSKHHTLTHRCIEVTLML